MFRIGLVDLDTSHPAAWLPLLNSYEDVKVVAVWDGGQVHPPGYAARFAAEHGVPYACESLEEMVELVDAAIIHSANWDLHVERAAPFIMAGKPTLIDKPMVGNLRDAMRLLDLVAQHGTSVMGGSSLRFAYEVAALAARREELGRVVSAFASGPGDFFNYGVHTAALMEGFFGGGVHSVSYVGSSGSELFAVEYREGPLVILELSAPAHSWFLQLTTEAGIITTKIDSSRLYDALVERFVGMLRTGQPPISLADSLEPVRVLLAAKEAQRTGERVLLEDLGPGVAFDGWAFVEEYRRRKYGG